MLNWVKKQALNLAVAMANTEKNTLGQEKIDDGIDTNKHYKLNQESVMDALLRGEVTAEVEKMRWRMYKTISSAKSVSAKITGYDAEGFPIVKTEFKGDEENLKNIKCEPSDDFKLIIAVDNKEYTQSVLESLNLDITELDEYTEDTINYNNIETDENGDETISSGTTKAKTLGVLSNDGHKTKGERPIQIFREHTPKFKLEEYTRYLYVREISHKDFLLEFYVSKYAEEFNKKSNFFISDLKKILENPKRYHNITDISKVAFISNDTIGVPDFLAFEYHNIKFDKIVEFNQYYVLKFKSEVLVNGESIIDKYKNAELEEAYNNKEKRV
jgi:hypothetical protein